jgi:hypothetical protein
VAAFGIAEGVALRMRLAGPLMPATSDDFAIPDDDGPDRRIWTGRSQPLRAGRERLANVPFVFFRDLVHRVRVACCPAFGEFPLSRKGERTDLVWKKSHACVTILKII